MGSSKSCLTVSKRVELTYTRPQGDLFEWNLCRLQSPEKCVQSWTKLVQIIEIKTFSSFWQN